MLYSLLFIVYIMFTSSVVLYCFFLFFFFKQKTAYEMRISDWSSDVCSSDLLRRAALAPDAHALPPDPVARRGRIYRTQCPRLHAGHSRSRRVRRSGRGEGHRNADRFNFNPSGGAVKASANRPIEPIRASVAPDAYGHNGHASRWERGWQ